jgi:hypothetical protein
MCARQSELFINQQQRTLTASQSFSARSHFRNILIVESRESWPAFLASFDPTLDVVLTYDFALRKQIEEFGGTALYVDHLCEPSFMQENNFLTYDFFRDWHLDAKGADLFRYREVGFGFSFRIEIWNDFTFYVRSRLCLEQLRSLSWENVYLDEQLPLLHEVLSDMGIDFKTTGAVVKDAVPFPGYFFPIQRWMNERLRIRLPRHVLRDWGVTVQGVVMSWLDRLTDRVQHKAGVFVQEYHPTRQLLQRLKQQPDIRVVQAHFSSAPGLMKFLKERPIPVYGSCKPYQKEAARLIENFRQLRSARLVLSNGVDITDAAYRVIERKVAEVLPESLRALNCVIDYLDRHPLRLEILIANIGQVAMLVDCVAKSRGVPSYMIINGLLGSAYLDEAKYATLINAYSTSIRNHYFRGMNNIVCLGDPRMDAYANVPARNINRRRPTITIGASGFNNIDLNSYLAVEFEFLHDVLSSIRVLAAEVPSIRVVLKVRPNGYLGQYQLFTDEFFPGLVDKIVDTVPMRDVLDESDLFISIYSQTLFEASCLGIPAIYHKLDQEIMDPPFDGKSELVTTQDRFELLQALRDFLEEDVRFNAFLKKSVMEKYVGPLDGKNLERNFDFIAKSLCE